MAWIWTLGMDNHCFIFISDYPSIFLNGRGVILEGSVGGDRLMVLGDEPQRVFPSGSRSLGLLDADFSALWLSEDNQSECDEDEPDEYLNDFSGCLSPEPLWHTVDLPAEYNYEMSANAEDEYLATDNSPPLFLHHGWSPDTLASQEKSENPHMGTTQSPDDPTFSEVQATLTALFVFLTIFQTFLGPLNREPGFNSPSSSYKSPGQSGHNYLEDMTVKNYNVTWKLDD